jgi:HAT1-interacting factor 1
VPHVLFNYVLTSERPSLQLDEIKTNPAADAQGIMPSAGGSGNTAPELAARQLDKELNSAAASAASKVALMASEVKDLSGLVKKKKKIIGATPGDQEPQSNGLKRKSPEEADEQGPDKRPKISEGAQPSEST